MSSQVADKTASAAAQMNQKSEVLAGTIDVIDQSLQLGERCADLDENTPLLGDIPELDSMAVLTVLTGLEEYFGIVVDDDDVSAETFATVGSLVDLVIEKLE